MITEEMREADAKAALQVNAAVSDLEAKIERRVKRIELVRGEDGAVQDVIFVIEGVAL